MLVVSHSESSKRSLRLSIMIRPLGFGGPHPRIHDQDGAKFQAAILT